MVKRTIKNYYEIFDIPYDAHPYQIKSAFRRLVKKYHPDVACLSSDDFIRIKEAFDILTDPKRRRLYDAQIGLNPSDGNIYRKVKVNVPPLKQDVCDDVVDVFKDWLRIPVKRKFSFELYLKDDEFKTGAHVTVDIPQIKICPHCFGFGGTIMSVCSTCKGRGVVHYSINSRISLKPPLSPGQIYQQRHKNHLLRFKLKRDER
jgi:molecular chaperone DnaJ